MLIPTCISIWSIVQDVADYLTKGGYGSESEGEDAADSRVMLERDMGRGNLAARQSRVRLQEVTAMAKGTWTHLPLFRRECWPRGGGVNLTLHTLHVGWPCLELEAVQVKEGWYSRCLIMTPWCRSMQSSRHS